MGHRLLNVLVDLLFFPGFTLPWTEELIADYWRDPSAPRARHLIWSPGVGSSTGVEGTTSTQYLHRITLLRLLLVILSRDLYHLPSDDDLAEPDEHDPEQNYGLKYLTTALDRPIVLPLLCSLLNTVLDSSVGESTAPATSWTSWAKSWVPSTLAVMGGAGGGGGDMDVQEDLVVWSVQLLGILLTYTPVNEQDELQDAPVELSVPSHERAPRRTVNWFRYYLARLHRPSDYALLWSGLTAWIEAGTQTTSSILGPFSADDGLPGSTPTGAHVTEALIVLWMSIRLNVGFESWIALDPLKANWLLAALLHFIHRFRSHDAQLPLVQSSAWIIQDLSSHKAWSACWAQPNVFPTKLLHSYLPVQPTKAYDALVSTATTLVPWSLPRPQYHGISQSLLLAVRNSASYWRDLTVVSSTKLAQLIASLSQPKVWLVGPPRPAWLTILLQAVARAWIAHPADQVNVLYALLTGAETDLAALGSWDLPKAMAHIGRLPRPPSKVQGTTHVDLASARLAAETYRSEEYVPSQEWIAEWQSEMQWARTTVVDALTSLKPAVEAFSADVVLKRHADQRTLAFVREWAATRTPSRTQEGGSEMHVLDYVGNGVPDALGTWLWALIYVEGISMDLWIWTRVRRLGFSRQQADPQPP